MFTPWRITIPAVAKSVATLFCAIIAMMILEGIVLGAWWRSRRQGIRPALLAANLMAGICLLMAAVVVVLGAAGPWLLVFLTLALIMHVTDLCMRWQS